ncbi:MAG: DUF1795 domain-containing protein [Chloroflexi bacterium]|nr:DUF1795 domain-containing protein [Chloroflexota bacterium]
MNRKFVPVFVLLILVLVTLACGGSAPDDETVEATSPPPAGATEEPVEPTSPPAKSAPETEDEGDYDTVFPLPDDVQNFTGGGGEEGINFQTSLSMDEAIEFYRSAFDKDGLTEYELLTSIEDEAFSMVFTGWHSGKELVIQGVAFGDDTNVNIRLEEVVDAAESAPPDTTGGDELRSDMGGFACQSIPGYVVEEAFGFASMDAPDADPDLGPSVVLIGGGDEESSTVEGLYDEFLAELEESIEVSEPKEIMVGGVPGLVAEISGDSEGVEMAGRIVFVAVSPTQRFLMFGAAALDRWEDELDHEFDAVVDSLTFFEPDFSLDYEEELTAGEEIAQWALFATASSEYGDFDWAAIQATGEPDTFECGDIATAWASADNSSVEWLELEYALPVRPSAVNIIQTHSPDQVVTVELIDPDGVYHEIYTGEPEDKSDECPYTLSIQVPKANYLATGVKITLDQSVIPATWNEIDAVELVGVTE